MGVRRMVPVVVLRLVLSGWALSHERAVATEPVPATPAQGPSSRTRFPQSRRRKPTLRPTGPRP